MLSRRMHVRTCNHNQLLVIEHFNRTILVKQDEPLYSVVLSGGEHRTSAQLMQPIQYMYVPLISVSVRGVGKGYAIGDKSTMLTVVTIP